MIITSGIFLLLWTISGLILYIRKAISLDITSGVSNFIVILFFILSTLQVLIIRSIIQCFLCMFCLNLGSSIYMLKMVKTFYEIEIENTIKRDGVAGLLMNDDDDYHD